MKRALNFMLTTAILAAGLSCSDQGDGVINVADDDAEMKAAIAKANASLPQFWQAFEKPKADEKDFALKVRITDDNGTEHFWATDIQRKEGKILGTINNEPNTVEKVKLGDRVVIPEADISDWTFLRGEKMVGNYTLRVLFKQMPSKEVEAYKKMMVEL